MNFARMHDVLSGHVSDGVLPGLVTLVSVGGDVHVDTIGTQAASGSEPMRRDSIFRIASMTKPVTAVAAMILVEECVLRLDDPIDRFLPELADRQVLTELSAPLDSTVPANRPITVRDLLTFRMGFGMVFGGDSPIAQAANDRQLGGGPPRALAISSDEYIARLASLPLLHQPGEKWMYHTSADVLGVLIERASGKPLSAFLQERVFGPLGMADTGFGVQPEKLSRFVTSYTNDPGTGELVVFDEPTGMWSSSQTAFESGGGGMVSTVDDFHTFGRMLLRHGTLDGVRILSPASVSLMTTDQLTPAQKAVSGFFPGYFDTRGWGFGMCVTTARDGLPPAGRYGWDGGLGTSWWSDPASDVLGILMTQRMAFPLNSAVYLDFWTTLYQEIP